MAKRGARETVVNPCREASAQARQALVVLLRAACKHQWILITMSSDKPAPYLMCPRCGSTKPAVGAG